MKAYAPEMNLPKNAPESEEHMEELRQMRQSGQDRRVIKTLYLCDGEVPECSKEHCYTRGEGCHHTSDVSHAKNNGKRKYRRVETDGLTTFVEFDAETE